jgi:LysM repeat protein
VDNIKYKKNDNYWNLESKYGWSHGTLKTLNPHIDPIKLQIGSLINIPSSSSSSSKSSAVAYKKPVSSLMSSKPVFEESKTPFGGGFSDSFGFHKTPFSTHKPFDPFGSGFSTPSYPSTVHKPIFTAKAPVHKSESLFYKELGARESSDNYEALNKLGYMGKYQMGTPALIDIGYKTKFGWTGKDGINNQKDFLNSSTVQEKAARAYHEVQWGYLKKVTTSEKTGKQNVIALSILAKKLLVYT